MKELFEQAIKTLIDVLTEACDFEYNENKIIIYSMGRRSYEDAFRFLINLGYAKGDRLKIEIERSLLEG
jgi:uncharacterized ubiquitin-like protein YukD